ncbi:3'-5' exonuclease [Thiohalorhabdus methylotrophus]|uniref:3'-5' exonuclease n=1 Tax=Thiohalorhabdus methylotrophus TaxID=3242694 RepID=A0ABV4TXI3_9GAMM
MNVLVFDIETVPDIEGGRRLFGLEGLSDPDTVRAMLALRRQESGGKEFLRHHLHRVVAISVVFRHPRLEEGVKVWSLGDPDSTEKELIQHFYDGLERYTPTLVSWNGSGFDLPVLHYRALVNEVVAPRYWEEGEGDREFRFNNYLNRFHKRHTDLMDVLAGYQGNANAPLDQVATLLGLPGKMGMDGSQVLDSWLEGDISGIRDYCETDVLNTYGVYLQWLVNTGQLSPEERQEECRILSDHLAASGQPHLEAFSEAWTGAHGR